MSIRLILADDQNIMREGLRFLLEKESDFEVIAEGNTGRAAVEMAKKHKPDIVVIDITMPELNGIQAARRIIEECPGVGVIALSVHSERQYVEGMLQAGALGYLLKDCAGQDLADAIRAVVKGQTYLSPKIAGMVVEGFVNHLSGQIKQSAAVLTNREREVLQLLAEGKVRKEIASILGISTRTVETHRRQIMEKINARSNAELTKYAIREGITPLNG
ncbi:MAG: response regulator transcription factor [Proteobacteria bacterium]|nr:response regulator transcription factor [Pseudomonadota bacterium]